ncbi:4155_t:CDS:1, partial [Scutellospora calospora]
ISEENEDYYSNSDYISIENELDDILEKHTIYRSNTELESFNNNSDLITLSSNINHNSEE